MSVKWKRCQNCGKKINDVAKKCPYCESTNFEKMYNPPTTQKNKIIVDLPPNANLGEKLKMKLFFWEEDKGTFVLSKTKIFSILIFLIYPAFFFIIRYQLSFYIKFMSSIIYGLKASLIVYAFGYLLHYEEASRKSLWSVINLKYIAMLIVLVSTFPNSISIFFKGIIISACTFIMGTVILKNKVKLKGIMNNLFSPALYNLKTNVIPLLFNWYEDHLKGKFNNINASHDKKIESKSNKREKTKKTEFKVKTRPKTKKSDNKKSKTNVNTNPKNMNRVNKPHYPKKTNIPPSLIKYKTQVNNLKNEFESKEKKVRELIKNRFEPPQLTYTKFISTVDKCDEIFNNHADAVTTMIELATKDTKALDLEIEKNIGILKMLIDKLDDLSNEIVLNIGKSKSRESDINTFIEDMEDLINSVKNYD